MKRLAALAILFAVSACAILEEQVPAIDTAASAAQQYGACLKLICETALWSNAPVRNCRIRPSGCYR